MEGVKTVDDPHDVVFDDLPTLLEEDARETVRSRGLIIRHLLNSLPNLFFGDSIIEAMQVNGLQVELVPVKIQVTRAAPSHDLREVVIDDLLLFLVISYPTLHMFDPVDVVLSSPSIDAPVEKLRVCVTFFKVRNPSALAFSSSL